VLQIAVAMADNQTITIEHLPDDFLQDLEPEDSVQQLHQENNITLLSEVTSLSPPDDNWLEVYEQSGRNVSATAKNLNISRNTLYKRLREQGLR
jgi:transcriptional regulator of acetoin/glycerol metabolism